MANVNVLLSCENEDKELQITRQCTFSEFRQRVKNLFPHLPKSFSISDGDYNELEEATFRLVCTSRLQAWFLVRADKECSFKLDHPQAELMSYDVHPNALTQSGNYHFSSSYQAFCEFIDNSIQATLRNNEKDLERTIHLHIFLKERLVAIFDNGEGMTYDGLKAFATYFLSQCDRGLEKEELDPTPAYLDGLISKFGVGATQAGFYLGDRIKVITKREECPFVTEISISKEKLHQRAKDGDPVFEDLRWIRNPCDTRTLELPEEKKCLKDLIEREAAYSQFTMVVISGLRDIHLDYMRQDSGYHLTRSLAHVYHFYLYGEKGRFGNMKLPNSFGSKNPMDEMSAFQSVDITLVLDDGKGPHHRKSFQLHSIDDDQESLYQQRAKEWFPFGLTLTVPGAELPQKVQGVLMYFPHEAGHETLPLQLDDEQKVDPIFECFWQGRLAPLSFVHRLEFCSPAAQRPRKQKDVLPDICFRRLKGILFFNRHTPISNNKLKILLDERKDLASALEDASTERRLPQDFRAWLEKCHRELDKEVSFENMLPMSQQPKNGDFLFSLLRVITRNGEQVYKVGDTVKLETRPVIFGKVLHFQKVEKRNGVDKVVVLRQPEEVYLNQTEERPISRIVEIPDPGTLRKVFNTERQLLPRSVKVYRDNPHNELPRRVTWIAGDEQLELTGFWVKVLSGESPPKAMFSLHNKKLSVQQVIEGAAKVTPVHNDQAYEAEGFGFQPFCLYKAGAHILKYLVFLGDREMCRAEFDIEVKANVGSFVRLIEPSTRETPTVALGEPSLRFKLLFRDNYDNPATTFDSGDSVVLRVTCPNLEVKGLKERYKPNKDGEVEVTNLTLEPKGHGRIPVNNPSVVVDAVGVGDVIFPIKLKTGQPWSLKLPQFDTTEVANYEDFPEFMVQVLDQWGQACSVTDRRLKLCADCDFFAKGSQFASVEQGVFGPIKIKAVSGKMPCTAKVKIALVMVETNRRRVSVAERVRELSQFTIKVLPSILPHKILIFKSNQQHEFQNGRCREGKECLELAAKAGSILKGLCLKAFDEAGKPIDVDELKNAQPKITTSWSGEVPLKNLPSLPDCPVAQLVENTFVGNVTCSSGDVTCQTQVRIRPEADQPKRWSFVCDVSSVEVECESRKQLSQNLKVQLLDRFGNPAVCPQGVVPLISVDHSPSKHGSTAAFCGELVRSSSDFVFTNDSVLTGHPGVLTMSVYDEGNKFIKDSRKVTLKAGPPHHIELRSQAFDSPEKKQTHVTKVLVNCYLSSPIFAFVCDKSGNKSPLKTTLNLSWVPGSSGQPASKKTNPRGEVVFPADHVKCNSPRVDQEIRIKVSSPDHRNLQAAVVTANCQLCNKVSKVRVNIEKPVLEAPTSFPELQVHCEAADGVQVDVLGHLHIDILRPDGFLLNASSVYRKPQNKDGFVLYQPMANRQVDQAGQYVVNCHFMEYRDRLKAILPPGEHLTRSSPVEFTVEPGPARRLSLRFLSGTPSVLSASSTADVKGRTILPQPTTGRGTSEAVEIVAEDNHKNVSAISATIRVTIEWPSGTMPEHVTLPALENNPVLFSMERGTARLPRLTLCSRVGNYIGDYLLVFSARDLESCSVRFSFSTDEHIQRIQTKLGPLKKQLSDLEQEHTQAKKRAAESRREMLEKLTPVRSGFRGEPRRRDVVTLLSTVKADLARKEQDSAEGVRPPAIQQGMPPPRIRQYIKGIVAELAFVTDAKLACLLSWYMQSKMSNALTTTTEQQRKVYEAGYAAYCEATLLPFQKRDFDGSDGKPLPLELPAPPARFPSPIEFAVNLLEFSGDSGYLRGTLFWQLLSRTIVVKDLKSGQTYRAHLTKMKQHCPTILTRDGHMIASDGLMDPKRRCPTNLQELRFSFGALPITETSAYQVEKERLEHLQILNTSFEQYEERIEEMKSKEGRLKQLKSQLSPQIGDLERELRKLRPITDRDNHEPADKRKRR